MAINWDLWNQAGQKLQNEARELYDFSWVTPEVVKGFTRYQALRPESEVRNAEEYEKAREGLEDEVNRRREQQWRTKWEADRAAEELQKDLDSGDMYDAQGLVDSAKEKGARKFTVPEGVRTRTGNFWKDTNIKVDPGLVETELLPPDEPGMTDEERAELETEIMRERLGDRYDALKRSYDVYGKLNPYERMIEAGKRSSYWDPEIGKIYTDAGEKIRQNNIDIWKAAQENKFNLLKLAQQRLESPYVRGSDLRVIRQLTNELNELAKKDPRGGGWFTSGGDQKTLDQYRADNLKMSDGLGNTISEDDFYANLRRGDIYKTLTDLRADTYYKAADPEEQALIEQEWNKNRNAFIENQKVKGEKIRAAVNTSPYGEELNTSEKLLGKLKMINFDNPNKNYMGMQIMDALKVAGYDVDRVLDADPTMRSIRSTLKGAKNKDWATILKENPNIGDLVIEGVAKTIFPMLRSQNVWEGNEDAITTFGKLLLADTENRYNEARKGARDMLVGWEGTFLDDRFDDWYKPEGAAGGASVTPPATTTGQGGEAAKSNDFETVFPTLKGVAPTKDNIEPINDTTGKMINAYLKNPSRFKLGEDGNGRPTLVWEDKKHIHVMTYIDGKWVAQATPVETKKKTPARSSSTTGSSTSTTMPEGDL